MRMRLFATAAIAAGLAGLAVPAVAEQQDAGRQVIDRVLDAILGPTPTPTPTPTPSPTPVYAETTIEAVLAHPRRGQDGERDRYRHPRETLAFFRVEPGMRVVDYLPANGWFTRILVPWLGPKGRYYAMGPDVSGSTNQYFLNSMGGLKDKFPGQAAQWNLAGGAPIAAFNTDGYPPELDGTIDRVLIFREMHNQFRFGWLNADMLAIRRMLKPGGMVGIEDHRMFENAPFSMTDGNKGYLRQSDVIALMDAYGFDLVGSSEINANPKDTKDWPQGVWMLPPGLRGVTDRTRARMLAIGESDRMTLLFRKRD